MVLSDLLEIDRIIQLDDLRSLRRERREPLVERRTHGRIGPAIEEAAQPAEPRRSPRVVEQSRCVFVSERVPSHRVEQESQVVDRAGNRTDVVEAGGERLDASASSSKTILVGFIPATPQNEAGRVIEPPVCVPIAPKHMPQATAAAEPLDEPPGVRSRFQGLRVIGGSIQA